MSKMIEATCVSGLVTAESVPVPSADILSQGVGSSSGILILDEDDAKYITSNATDIKTTIEKVNSALSEIASALTAIAAQMLGPATAPPPTLPASVIAINLKVTELTALKEMLK
jgi:hypothetical protein